MSSYLVYRLRVSGQTAFLPAPTSHGHYQIEMACNACHTPLMGVREDACLQCHANELRAVNDSHPKSKFTDPRNADLLLKINAANCVTCHREHVPEQTRAMGVTLPDDYCFHCHQATVTERPSHQGYGFNTCSTAGCHNYHDNTALYEDFLVRHLDEPWLRADPRVPVRVEGASRTTSSESPSTPSPTLAAEEHDAPVAAAKTDIIEDWALSAHARAGVNCRDCHQPGPEGPNAAPWNDHPDHASCARCHDAATEGFLAGRHGMRLAQGLEAMEPRLARLPMHATAGHLTLTCASCHGAHRYDTRHAAVDACMTCHSDTHTRNYSASPHAALWKAELEGTGEAGTGVSCATCHLPRETTKTEDNEGTLVRVQHNQNLNLRPNEKMVRSVCLSCHGLGFTLDALADPALIHTNFAGQPSRRIESLDWVARRQPSKEASPNRN